MKVRNKNKERRLPGEEGIWAFVMGDLLMFLIFFCLYLYYRSQDLQLYIESQVNLSVAFGLANTIILLTSSLFVVLAVKAVQQGDGKSSKRFVLYAILSGVAFGISKAIEWGDKFEHGITLVTNEFFMYYFIITGLHLIHLIVGLLLFVIYLSVRRGIDVCKPGDLRSLESIATFWHMVDLLWIVIFPLLYLVR